jgi:hypothetical protein
MGIVMTRSLEDIRQSLTRESRKRWGAARTEALRPVLEQTAREIFTVEQCVIPRDEEPLFQPPPPNGREGGHA